MISSHTSFENSQPLTHPAITIRIGTLADIPGIAEISVAAWKWAFSSFLPPEFVQSRTDLNRRNASLQKACSADQLCLVAVNDQDTICGYALEHSPCSLEGYQAEIGGLYVHPEMARMGIGLALVKSMVGEFCWRGSDSMAIHTLAQNEIGCNFYAKLGGVRDQETSWNGYPSVWYVWPDLIALNERLNG